MSIEEVGVGAFRQSAQGIYMARVGALTHAVVTRPAIVYSHSAGDASVTRNAQVASRLFQHVLTLGKSAQPPGSGVRNTSACFGNANLLDYIPMSDTNDSSSCPQEQRN